MKPNFSYLMVVALFVLSCNQHEPIRTLSWTGTSHTIADTFIFEKDTQIVKKDLYLAYQIVVSDTGCRLITRKDYDAPRQFYKIAIKDSLKEVLFRCAFDTAVVNFKEPVANKGNYGIIYCDFNHLLGMDVGRFHYHINYVPPRSNTQIKKLHHLFEYIQQHPIIIAPMVVDTLAIDSAVYERVKGFMPRPPLKSTITFTPPPYSQND